MDDRQHDKHILSNHGDRWNADGIPIAFNRFVNFEGPMCGAASDLQIQLGTVVHKILVQINVTTDLGLCNIEWFSLKFSGEFQ